MNITIYLRAVWTVLSNFYSNLAPVYNSAVARLWRK